MRLQRVASVSGCLFGMYVLTVGLLAASLSPTVAAQEPVRGGTLTMVVQPEPPILVSAFNSAAPIWR
jgi:hypothetical protein